MTYSCANPAGNSGQENSLKRKVGKMGYLERKLNKRLEEILNSQKKVTLSDLAREMSKIRITKYDVIQMMSEIKKKNNKYSRY
jgi:hypothetical protein